MDEKKLGQYLKQIFPRTDDWIVNKAFKPYRFRPDYKSDSLKLVVEFDGPLHYTSPEKFLGDYCKNRLIIKAGYKIVRVPCFVQISRLMVKAWFGVKFDVDQIYPHGFIFDAKTLKMPAEFCELGVKRVNRDLETFSFARKDIIKSLRCKIEKLGDLRLVLPPSLKNLVR